ncbi:MAG TPA: hypothetical protein VK646_02355 [Actinomycetota bacterium]|nr:hypothetical protein [Actinomycetota bacterium]
MRSRGVPPANSWRAFFWSGETDPAGNEHATRRRVAAAAGAIIVFGLLVAWVVIGTR